MVRYARMTLLLLASAALVTSAAACGDDDDNGDGDATATQPAATRPASTPTAARTEPAVTEAAPTEAAPTVAPADPTPTAPAAGGSIAVTATDFAFAPSVATAPAGAVTVTLANAGSFPHTLTLYNDQAYTSSVSGGDSGQIAGGGTGDFTVTLEAGTYFFRCEIHPDPMQGTITAQ